MRSFFVQKTLSALPEKEDADTVDYVRNWLDRVEVDPEDSKVDLDVKECVDELVERISVLDTLNVDCPVPWGSQMSSYPSEAGDGPANLEREHLGKREKKCFKNNNFRTSVCDDLEPFPKMEEKVPRSRKLKVDSVSASVKDENTDTKSKINRTDSLGTGSLFSRKTEKDSQKESDIEKPHPAVSAAKMRLLARYGKTLQPRNDKGDKPVLVERTLFGDFVDLSDNPQKKQSAIDRLFQKLPGGNGCVFFCCCSICTLARFVVK